MLRKFITKIPFKRFNSNQNKFKQFKEYLDKSDIEFETSILNSIQFQKTSSLDRNIECEVYNFGISGEFESWVKKKELFTKYNCIEPIIMTHQILMEFRDLFVLGKCDVIQISKGRMILLRYYKNQATMEKFHNLSDELNESMNVDINKISLIIKENINRGFLNIQVTDKEKTTFYSWDSDTILIALLVIVIMFDTYKIFIK
jgi:hypothetical protein